MRERKDRRDGRGLGGWLVVGGARVAVGQLLKLVLGTAPAVRLEGIRMPAGQAREVSASIVASRVEDAAEVSGLIIPMPDSTDHRHLEVQLAQSQKMRAIGQLAGGIVHDFNNQRTATLSFCHLSLAFRGPTDPSFEHIMQIRGNAMRASDLVRQLPAFSRKQKLQPVEIDVNEVLADAAPPPEAPLHSYAA